MILIWSVVLWSRSYCLTVGSRIIGKINVYMHLSAHLVGDVVILSAILSINLPEDRPYLREGVQTALMRYGTIQSRCGDDPIVIAVEQDPWRIKDDVKDDVEGDLMGAFDRLGLNIVRTSCQHWGVTTMTPVERFFQRAPHLMMIARSQVDGAWTGGPPEASLPWSMFQDELSLGTLQDLVIWIGESKEGRYDALLSSMARGVKLRTSWGLDRP